jgi:hypothetical protein
MLGTWRARTAGICVMAGVVLLALAALGPSAKAAANPLSGWTQQGGDANWQVQPSGNSVYVVAPNPDFDNTNGPASFFVSPANVSGTFNVTISANTESVGEESDYIGFALGYTAPLDGAECSNANKCATSFGLFDWKKETEKENGEALDPSAGGQEGFSLMRVAGVRDLQNNNTPDHPACFWTHEDVDNFCDLLTDFGADKGYDFGVSYTFQVTYIPSKLKIVLKGTGGNPDKTIWDIGPPGGTSFPAGRFAFYNYSQPNVEYSFDDGTAPATTTTTSVTPTTVAGNTTTTASAGGATTTIVGPVTKSSIVRTGPNSVVTMAELFGGVGLLMIGALLTAVRGRRPDGTHFA